MMEILIMEESSIIEYPNDNSKSKNVNLIEKNYYNINIYYYVTDIILNTT